MRRVSDPAEILEFIDLRKHRLRLTQDQVAQAAGVTPRAVKYWEAGQRPIPAGLVKKMQWGYNEFQRLAYTVLGVCPSGHTLGSPEREDVLSRVPGLYFQEIFGACGMAALLGKLGEAFDVEESGSGWILSPPSEREPEYEEIVNRQSPLVQRFIDSGPPWLFASIFRATDKGPANIYIYRFPVEQINGQPRYVLRLENREAALEMIERPGFPSAYHCLMRKS